jgi:hypothetical protein
MRRILVTILLLMLFVLACKAVTPLVVEPSATLTSPPPTSSPSPMPTRTAPPTQTQTPTPSPPPPTVEPSPTASQVPPPAPAFMVRWHPDGGLYVGDVVSIEVIAPAGMDLEEDTLEVRVDDPNADLVGSVGFAPFGIGGRYQATMFWVWDTAGLLPGEHALNFSVQPEGITWTKTVSLGPQSALPPPEPEAHWAHDESDCCLFYYITGTAAERDMLDLLTRADAQAEDVIQQMGVVFEEPIEVTLMSRVLGHGGFAGGEIYISYLDRNYAGSILDVVLHHEMVHILDAHLGGELRPTMFVEGLAVYLTGGHFKPEPLMPRAAVLLSPSVLENDLGLDWYLPMVALADDFYTSQHEIGYLQAGALVEYMVDTWGWEAFSDFYRDIHPHPEEVQSLAIDLALQTHCGLSFEQLEVNFIAALKNQEISAEYRDDVRLTVAFYDTVRRYQQAGDSSAYFLTAWLPNGPQMRELGVVADLLRHPSTGENLALETLLVAASGHFKAGRYVETEETLDAVNMVLDAMGDNNPKPFTSHPLAMAHYEIVQALLDQGYQSQNIQVTGSTARAEASADGLEVVVLELVEREGGWVLKSITQ